MHIIKNDNTNFNFNINSYKQDIDINYTLLRLSNGKYKSITRGKPSDTYITEITINNKRQHIDDLLLVLKELKDNNKELVIIDCPENIFGEHIEHANLHTIVKHIGTYKLTTKNSYSITIQLILDAPIFKTESLGPDLSCLEYSSNNTISNSDIVLSTYNDNILYNKDNDNHIFEGSYLLCNEEISKFYLLYQDQRGLPFDLIESNWGVSEMFGPGLPVNHNVTILEANYEYVSVFMKRLTIKLYRNY